MAEVTLAHHLSERDVAALGLPPGTYDAGDTIDVDPGTAARLMQAGLTTVDPTDQDAVGEVLTGNVAAGITGRWYVTLARTPVSLADIRANNRIPTVDVYRIEKRRDGVLLTFLWAKAGAQILDSALTAAQQNPSPPPVPMQPTPNDLVSSGDGGGGVAGTAYVDPLDPAVLIVPTNANAVIDPADPAVLILTV